MYNGDGIFEAFIVLMVILIVSVPLAIWKMVDITIWVFTHVTINWN